MGCDLLSLKSNNSINVGAYNLGYQTFVITPEGISLFVYAPISLNTSLPTVDRVTEVNRWVNIR